MKADTQPQKTRALPIRRTFLSNAVLADLEQEQAHQAGQNISGDQVLLIFDDSSLMKNCQIMDGVKGIESTERRAVDPAMKQIEIPSFRVIEPGKFSRKKSKATVSTENISDEAYIKRHAKEERAEKKLKNRERERLEHELYQQQITVERLRNMDRSNLLSIAATVRRSDSGQRELEDVESLRKRLLKEAEQQLKRYRMLGLGSHRKDLAFATSGSRTDFNDTTSHHESGSIAAESDAGDAGLSNLALESTGHFTDTDNSSITPSTIASNSHVQLAPSKKRIPTVSTLKRHNTSICNGKRKSPRILWAFGARIPTFEQEDFSLPLEEFGPAMEKHATSRTSKRSNVV